MTQETITAYKCADNSIHTTRKAADDHTDNLVLRGLSNCIQRWRDDATFGYDIKEVAFVDLIGFMQANAQELYNVLQSEVDREKL